MNCASTILSFYEQYSQKNLWYAPILEIRLDACILAEALLYNIYALYMLIFKCFIHRY